MSAFTPFYRNHNVAGAADQEPYRWDSVAEAARTAIAARYALLPYWVRYPCNAFRSLRHALSQHCLHTLPSTVLRQ